jgi:hypothetical protein
VRSAAQRTIVGARARPVRDLAVADPIRSPRDNRRARHYIVRDASTTAPDPSAMIDFAAVLPKRPAAPEPDLPPRVLEPDESCDRCGSTMLEWRKCKLICRACRSIVKSCADL